MAIEIQVNDAVSFVLTVLRNVATAVGRFVAAGARRLTRRTLERPDIARALGPSIVRLLSSAAYYLLLALAGAASLIALGVPSGAVLAVVAIVVIILAVAFQQSTANFAATIAFLMFQPFRRGELVLTMGHMGTVVEILLFDTVLRQAWKITRTPERPTSGAAAPLPGGPPRSLASRLTSRLFVQSPIS